MKTYNKSFLSILFLIGVTIAVMAFLEVRATSLVTTTLPNRPDDKGIVAVDAHLVQEKVLKGSDGQISVSLTLTGADIPLNIEQDVQPVDLVVVLDRSSSMSGQKISDARTAVKGLMNRLNQHDRMALITYSNGVEILSPLVYMTHANQQILSTKVSRIRPGGGTNLGGGLKNGISTMKQAMETNRQRKVILISDGLANQGITGLDALGAMAANGVEHNLGVSTVGVGYDFNEILMTTIADYGSGNYYFLETPQAFAEVFEKEFQTARNIVAGNLEIRISLHDGMQLVNAGGFPIKNEGSVAIVRPGDLLSGQTRKLFLTYTVPTEKQREFSLSNIEVHYRHNGTKLSTSTEKQLAIACIDDHKEVVASIDSKVWSEQVVQEDFNKLQKNVADAIRNGQKEEALRSIKEYEVRNSALNSTLRSESVTKNLEGDVQALRLNVNDTFTGAPAAVAEKKKQQSKILQYESYQKRRAKN